MTEKTPTSINLERDHVEWMDSENKNRSAFINDLLETYRQVGGVDNAIKKHRIDQLKSRKREVESRLQSIENQIAELESQMQTAEEAKREKVEATFVDMHGIPADPENMAVQNQAERFGMTPEEFAHELQQWRQDNA